MGLRLHRPIRGLMDGALRTASRTYGPAHFSGCNEVDQELSGLAVFSDWQQGGAGIKFSKPEYEWVSRVGWQGCLGMDKKVVTRYKVAAKYKICDKIEN